VVLVKGAVVSVAVVGSRVEAELIVGFLRSNSVEAAVSADDAGGQEPQLQLQGVRVLVASSDEAAARQLLAAVEDSPARSSAAESGAQAAVAPSPMAGSDRSLLAHGSSTRDPAASTPRRN
jgi:hypothetical protein